jgi:hypothetical protein
MSTIFISYRRADVQGWAGRLSAGLAQVFGDAARFFDISSIPPGVDFLIAIQQALKHCSAALVIIGPDWLEVAGETGVRRLDDPKDVVRTEVATALAQGIPVIPVLVGGAAMPRDSQLPEALRPLARRNAIELSASRWNYDCDRLFDALAEQTRLNRRGATRSDQVAISVAAGLRATESEFGNVTGVRGAATAGTQVEVLHDATLTMVKMGDITGVDIGSDKAKT